MSRSAARSAPAAAPSAPGPTPRPVIGLSCYLEPIDFGPWSRRAALLPHTYLDLIVAAGGVPVLLPPQPATSEAVTAVLDRVDGLVLTGGKDVDPRRYGEQPGPSTDAPREDRDAWETALARAAAARDLPLLGICRGLQVLDVAFGGSLVQHLPDALGSDRYSGDGATFRGNPVRTAEGSLAARILGPTADVRSYHHQAVARVADGLTPTARGADDEVVQALEVDGMTFGLAVQWHPEESPDDLRIARALVAAARAAAALTAAGARP